VFLAARARACVQISHSHAHAFAKLVPPSSRGCRQRAPQTLCVCAPQLGVMKFMRHPSRP
jgi:hypothetical protein